MESLARLRLLQKFPTVEIFAAVLFNNRSGGFQLLSRSRWIIPPIVFRYSDIHCVIRHLFRFVVLRTAWLIVFRCADYYSLPFPSESFMNNWTTMLNYYFVARIYRSRFLQNYSRITNNIPGLNNFSGFPFYFPQFFRSFYRTGCTSTDILSISFETMY